MDKSFPKVSVLMPVYNTEETYLRKAIESILDQTYSDFEFIIINDGSTNNAREVILSYNDSRIRYFEQENRGIARTTNRMIDIAKGKYIALMDSDDISVNNRLAVQVGYLENHSEVGVLSAGYKEIVSGNCVNDAKTFEIKYIDLVKNDVITNPAAIIRRDVLNTYSLRYNENFVCAQDYELWSRVIRYTKIVVLKDILLLYRVREDSNSHGNSSLMQRNDRIIRQNMLDFLTSDKEKQTTIMQIVSGNYKLQSAGNSSQNTAIQHWSFWEKIFSVKNVIKNNKKYKILMLLGIKIKLKKYNATLDIKVVKLMGGLGNQMFQYAFGKALEQVTGEKVIFDRSWFREAQKTIINDKMENASGVVIRNYALDIFNLDISFSTDYQLANCQEKVQEKNAFIYDKDLLKIRNSASYVGYFQNENYFKNIRKIIEKDFSFPPIAESDVFNQKWLKKIRGCENSVFIHIRRGDYMNLSGWPLPISYYKRAIEYIKSKVQDPVFFVFGQDCEDYIKNEFFVDVPLEIIGEMNSKGGQDWKDMFLMQQCKHAVIANSTFSWWGAWLGKANKEGIVIAPSPFVNGQTEIICDNWIRIDTTSSD